MLASREVVVIMLVTERLALETDVVVSHLAISEVAELHEPLHEVPEVEEHVEHLLHLCRMDGLVHDRVLEDGHPLPCEEDAEEVDAAESLERG